jgi:23S rRNA pseudouridine1911/1915/1917 synthase
MDYDKSITLSHERLALVWSSGPNFERKRLILRFPRVVRAQAYLQLVQFRLLYAHRVPMPATFPMTITVAPESAGQRLDQFLAAQLPDTSRSRVQQLIAEEKALVGDAPAKPSLKLRGGEQITILGDPVLPPLRALAEDIPLDVIFEDADLAVVNKPAGMMVHAGAGATDDERNRGTLVNALLHRFRALSEVGGELRPGIVHRLDKETSGLIVVAKNDVAHRKLAAQFSGRKIKKQYVALVHGWPAKDRGTINAAISRDQVRRTRMTTKGRDGRTAVTHYELRRRIESPYGKFALVDVHIETGRTHQIRVHMSSMGHPVVGDALYGAPRELRMTAAGRAQSNRVRSRSSAASEEPSPVALSLDRNFLHAVAIEFAHPRTGKPLAFKAPLPTELELFLAKLGAEVQAPQQL